MAAIPFTSYTQLSRSESSEIPGMPSHLCGLRLENRRDDELWDPQRTAQYLNVKVHTLSVWRTSHRYALAYVKIGRRVAYWRSDVIGFAEANTIAHLKPR